jgi:hypothetical protein
LEGENDNGTEIFIGGRADKFRALYEEEFKDIVNGIRERIKNGTN